MEWILSDKNHKDKKSFMACTDLPDPNPHHPEYEICIYLENYTVKNRDLEQNEVLVGQETFFLLFPVSLF